MKINSRLPINNPSSPTKETTDAKLTGGNKADVGPALTAGSIIKGTVLKTIEDGKALLNIGGRTITAKTMVPLKSGDDLLLEVKDGGSTPLLALAGRKGVAQEIVRLLFTEGADITKAVEIVTGGDPAKAVEIAASGDLPAASAPKPAGALPVAPQTAPTSAAPLQAATVAKAVTASLTEGLNNLQQAADSKESLLPPAVTRQLAQAITELTAPLQDKPFLANELKAVIKSLETFQQIEPKQPGNQQQAMPPLPAPLLKAVAELQQQIGREVPVNRLENNLASGKTAENAIELQTRPEKIINLLELTRTASEQVSLAPTTDKQPPEALKQLAAYLDTNKSLVPELKSMAKSLETILQTNVSAAPEQPAKTALPITPLLETVNTLMEKVNAEPLPGLTEADKLTKLATALPGGEAKQPAPVLMLARQLTETLTALSSHLGNDRSPLAELKTIVSFIETVQQTFAAQTQAQPATAVLPASLLEALDNLHQIMAPRAIDGHADANKLSQQLDLLRPQGKETLLNPKLEQQLHETTKQLAAQLGDDHPSVNELKSLTKLLHAHQQLNHPQPGKPPEFLLFPCFFAGKSGWGEWTFQMEESGSGQERETTCSIDFFLQMSRIGDVHMKVLMQKDGIRGDLFVAEETIRSHLIDSLPELTAIFESYGYQPVSLTVHQSAENLLHSFKKSLEAKTKLKSFALVDITA